MASRRRPRAAKSAMGKQAAALRRSAPGKRYVGERAAQSAGARRAQRAAVARMAEVDAAERRAERLEVPLASLVAELAEVVFDLVRSLVLAPFRIAAAARRARRA